MASPQPAGIAKSAAGVRAMRAPVAPPPAVNALRSADGAPLDEPAASIRHSIERLADGRFRVSLRTRENGFVYLFHRESVVEWTQVGGGGIPMQAQVSLLTPPVASGELLVVFARAAIANPNAAVLMSETDGHVAITITLK